MHDNENSLVLALDCDGVIINRKVMSDLSQFMQTIEFPWKSVDTDSESGDQFELVEQQFQQIVWGHAEPLVSQVQAYITRHPSINKIVITSFSARQTVSIDTSNASRYCRKLLLPKLGMQNIGSPRANGLFSITTLLPMMQALLEEKLGFDVVLNTQLVPDSITFGVSSKSMLSSVFSKVFSASKQSLLYLALRLGSKFMMVFEDMDELIAEVSDQALINSMPGRAGCVISLCKVCEGAIEASECIKEQSGEETLGAIVATHTPHAVVWREDRQDTWASICEAYCL